MSAEVYLVLRATQTASFDIRGESSVRSDTTIGGLRRIAMGSTRPYTTQDRLRSANVRCMQPFRGLVGCFMLIYCDSLYQSSTSEHSRTRQRARPFVRRERVRKLTDIVISDSNHKDARFPQASSHPKTSRSAANLFGSFTGIKSIGYRKSISEEYSIAKQRVNSELRRSCTRP